MLRQTTLLLTFGLLTAGAFAQTSITTQANFRGGGSIQGFYETGCADMDCTVKWEKVLIRFNIAPSDVGRPGMLYVGGFTDAGNGALMTPAGDWSIWRGGLHDPSARFEYLPPSITFTILDTSHLAAGLLTTGGFSRALHHGPTTVCELIRSFGEFDAELGGGYGAVQDGPQDSIDQLMAFEHMQLDLDHLRGAYAYTDGLQNRKYGTVLTFDCNCGVNAPLEAGGGCSGMNTN